MRWQTILRSHGNLILYLGNHFNLCFFVTLSIHLFIDVTRLEKEIKQICLDSNFSIFKTKRHRNLLTGSSMMRTSAINGLTLWWQRSLSYRNQSIDLLSKSMDWFLYDRDLRHERVSRYFGKITQWLLLSNGSARVFWWCNAKNSILEKSVFWKKRHLWI